MRVAEVCCGAGGMSLGLKRAGLEIVAAFDSWPKALAVYRGNFPEPKTLLRKMPRFRGRHARSADLGDLLGLVPYLLDLNVDLIAGGPPCQDFSKAGKQIEGTRADMTLAFAALIAIVRPQWILMENVEEVVKSRAWQRARRILKRAGYGLSEQVLNASQFGVGQRRRRFIAIGRLGEEDGFLTEAVTRPDDAPHTTVRDILGGDVGVHPGFGHPDAARAFFCHTFSGRRGVWSVDEPCPTITRNSGGKVGSKYKPHAKDTTDARKTEPLTWEQLAALQGFPRDWRWNTTMGARNLMIANALPPPVSEAIGRAILARHRGDSIPALETGFIGWLMAEKGYAGPTLRNRCSQVNRARRLLKGRILADLDLELAMLQRTKEFMTLNPSVRSDLLGALSLHAEWRASLRAPIVMDVDDADDGEEDRSPPVLHRLSERLRARSETVDAGG